MADLAKMNTQTCETHGDKCPDICVRCRHGIELHLGPPDGCLQAGCLCRQFVRADGSIRVGKLVLEALEGVEKALRTVNQSSSEGAIAAVASEGLIAVATLKDRLARS
jgi:hypothetical protein